MHEWLQGGKSFSLGIVHAKSRSMFPPPKMQVSLKPSMDRKWSLYLGRLSISKVHATAGRVVHGPSFGWQLYSSGLALWLPEDKKQPQAVVSPCARCRLPPLHLQSRLSAVEASLKPSLEARDALSPPIGQTKAALVDNPWQPRLQFRYA